MSLRINSGRFKGREIKTPKTTETKPVTSILRKSIFDSCQMFIEGAVVLDLFAGSGVIGIEALSRGAAFAIFVDISPIAIRCIRENIATLALENESIVTRGDAFEVFPKLKKQIDIAFLDPPYPIGLPGYLRLVKMMKDHPTLFAEDAHLYLEIPSTISKEVKEAALDGFTLIKERRSSTTTLLHLTLCLG